MKKEDYILKSSDIRGKIRELHDELEDLENEYIGSNILFPIGSKVLITKPKCLVRDLIFCKLKEIPETKRYAYIIGYHINGANNVVPDYMKAKKDGSISQIRDCSVDKRDIVTLVGDE